MSVKSNTQEDTLLTRYVLFQVARHDLRYHRSILHSIEELAELVNGLVAGSSESRTEFQIVIRQWSSSTHCSTSIGDQMKGFVVLLERDAPLRVPFI
jgi:hypothetical protein